MEFSTHNLRIELGKVRLVIPVKQLIIEDELVIDLVRSEVMPMLLKHRLTDYNMLKQITKWVNGRCKV
jgi:hypothetical protein